MAESADKVIVELEARLGRYTANIAGAERHFDRSMRNIQGSAARTEARVASAFRSMATAAGVTIGVAGIIAGARAFLQYADAAKNMEAQLRLATRATGNFAQAQEDVRRISAETRSGLESTTDLYAAFQRNARDLGITQAQVARITQTVTESFLISGASTSESAAATRQLVQAFQSGVLRGDEFNSMSENAPRLQRLLADSLGVTVGALRAMAEEGDLSAQKLASAFSDTRLTAALDAEFRELPVTFDQAMTLVNNAAIITFGAFDRGGQFSTALANFFGQGAEGFGQMGSDAENAGAIIRATMAGLTDVFNPMVAGASDSFSTILTMAEGVRQSISMIAHEFQALVNNYRGAMNAVDEGGYIGTRGHPLLSRLIVRGRPRAPADFADRMDQRTGSALGRLQTDVRARRLGLGVTQSGRNTPGREFQRWLNEPGRYDLFGRELHPSRPRPAPSGGGGGGRRGGRGRSEDPEAVARREAAEAQRFQNELAQLNEDLLAARQAMVTAADAVAAYEVQQIEAARDRQNAAYQAVVDQTRGNRELAQSRADELILANNAVAAERVRLVGLREQDRIAQERVDVARAGLDNAAEMEQAEGALAVTAEERRDSALRLLDLSKEQEQLELEGVLASRTASQAQKDIAQARLDMLDSLYQARAQDALNNNLNVRDSYLRDLRQAGHTINEQIDQVAVDGFQRLNTELADAVTNFLNLGGVAGRVLSDILNGLIRIAIQQAIIKPLANALFGGTGGSGFFAGLFGGGGGGGGGGPVPGYASGGSFMVGGNGGVDRNLLSINGQPRAMVSGSERITVTPQGKAFAAMGGQAAARSSQTVVNQTFVLDARHGITTPELLAHVNQVKNEAVREGAAMGVQMGERRAYRRARQSL